jgi:hypothetical protein
MYNAAAHAATVAATGVGGAAVTGAFVVTYTPGGSTVPVNAGSYGVSVAFTTSDLNYTNGAGSGSITINPATPTVTVSGGPFMYNGAAHAATVAATGVGGAAVSGSFVVTYTPGGSTVPINPGTYGVGAAFTSTDSNYTHASGSGSIAITFGTCLTGQGGVILPPINSDGTSVYNRKGGSTIPVKFRVCNAAGVPISNPAAVFAGTGGSLTMLSAVRGTVTNALEDSIVDIPDVAFRWDTSGQQWIFNMATSNLSAGSTYGFQINLAYGPANIVFKVGVK